MWRVDLFFVSVLNILNDLNVWSAFDLFHRRRPFQLRPDVVPPLVVQRDRSSLRVEERLVVQPEKVCLELRKINLKSCTDKVYLQTNKTSKILHHSEDVRRLIDNLGTTSKFIFVLILNWTFSILLMSLHRKSLVHVVNCRPWSSRQFQLQLNVTTKWII